MDKLSEYIKTFDNILSLDDCNYILDWFEENEHLHEDGVVYTHGENGSSVHVDPSFKLCRQAKVPPDHKISQILTETVVNAYDNYGKGPKNNLHLTGYGVRRYPKGEGLFATHIDTSSGATLNRIFGIIIYLNDVEEGGETEFPELGVKITPKKGRVLIFPCNWMYPHKGNIPISNDKYMSAMFIWFSDNR